LILEFVEKINIDDCSLKGFWSATTIFWQKCLFSIHLNILCKNVVCDVGFNDIKYAYFQKVVWVVREEKFCLYFIMIQNCCENYYIIRFLQRKRGLIINSWLENSWVRIRRFRLWSISSTCYARIFWTKVLCATVFFLHVTREKLPKRLLYEKVVHKTLMKLTPGMSMSSLVVPSLVAARAPGGVIVFNSFASVLKTIRKGRMEPD